MLILELIQWQEHLEKEGKVVRVALAFLMLPIADLVKVEKEIADVMGLTAQMDLKDKLGLLVKTVKELSKGLIKIKRNMFQKYYTIW
jgi:hypothetical protein